MKPLKFGSTSQDVRYLQAALNARSTYYRRAYGAGFPQIAVDGVLGPDTQAAVQRVARALGALESTLAAMRDQRSVPVGVQRIIRWPSGRTPAQLARAATRKHAAKKAAAQRPLGAKAWDQAGRDLDVREQGRNNAGPGVARIIRDGGGNPADYPAWCAYAVAAWYRRAGSTVDWTRTWGAVRLMHTPAGVNITTSPKIGSPVRFRFDHIGLFGGWCDAQGRPRPRLLATHIRTREGNTGATGAVSDSRAGGDGVREKIRHKSLVSDYLEVTR